MTDSEPNHSSDDRFPSNIQLGCLLALLALLWFLVSLVWIYIY